MFRFSPVRSGLTRTDVIVLLVIVSLVTCLGGCWVGNCRVDGARTHSLDNLKQIAIAAHYWSTVSEDANTLPDAGIVQKTSTGEELKGPFAAILPQMEQQRIFDSGSSRDILKPYISPNDSTNKDLAGRASYAWNGGWILEKKGEAKLTPPDGASNTLLLCERVMTCNNSNNMWSGTHPGTDLIGNGKPFIPGVKQASENSFATAGTPPAWATNTPASPDTCDRGTPSGCHKGVILVAMGDCSTRSVSKAAGTEQNWSVAITPASDDKFDANW